MRVWEGHNQCMTEAQKNTNLQDAAAPHPRWRIGWCASVGASPWLKNYAPWTARDIELPETSLSHLIDEAVRTVPSQGGAGVLWCNHDLRRVGGPD